MSTHEAWRPGPQPVYDEEFAKRAREATKQAMAKRKGR